LFYGTEDLSVTITRLVSPFGLLLALVASAHCQNILYQHNFSGSAATPLHQLTPDVNNNGGGTRWITRTDTGQLAGIGREYYADGHIDTSIDPGVNGSASLGFAPLAGSIYTLTVRSNAISTVGGGEPYNWLGIGFSSGYATGAGAGAEFFGNGNADQVLGQPWMLLRADNSQFPNQFATGPGVTGIANWPTPVTSGNGSPADLRIVLNTTAANWTVEWLAKIQRTPTTPAWEPRPTRRIPPSAPSRWRTTTTSAAASTALSSRRVV
jgi:hypothetical protein